jgi:UDP-GlcNAc:undecaprenyl-phosphate/decaprenyl-phosphate GlcNAc-1-phosphate transferase
MNIPIIEHLIVVSVACLLVAIIVIPVIKKVAIRVGLIDKPNARKVHTTPVPLIGGVSIGVTALLVLPWSDVFISSASDNLVWISGALVMLVIGVLDDRFDIKASVRLAVQMLCALIVASAGIRITSLYGLFGIYELPLLIQYVLTVVLIAGVVNAYNLMDGIDGLLGGLSIIGASVLGVISYERGLYDLTIIYGALVGALIGFLRFNLSSKKVFMGDAGSLFLGFILVVTAIKQLDTTGNEPMADQLKVLLLIAGIFLVPVMDSLRVYRGRIKKGTSPFKADKTHLHHLFLYMGITHRRATILILLLATTISGTVMGLLYLLPVTWVIISAVVIFVIVATILSMNHSVVEWREKLRRLEE